VQDRYTEAIMLNQAAQHVVDVPGDRHRGPEQVKAAGQEFFNLLGRSTASAAAEALGILSQGIDPANGERAVLVALMVEQRVRLPGGEHSCGPRKSVGPIRHA
jgi:hypothetical protein